LTRRRVAFTYFLWFARGVPYLCSVDRHRLPLTCLLSVFALREPANRVRPVQLYTMVQRGE